MSGFGSYNSGAGTVTEAPTSGALTIDGIVLVNDDRVLLKNQAATGENGIYVVSGIGAAESAVVLTRSDDMNENTEVAGAY